ncbi:glycosyltransferase [Mycobacterium sp. PS03-16]|uniref:glycosyltransferase n=1 Tax=Mycobacterium sp. PS03-16 TaxID=2559611 RepID=UPI0010732950|nr:glycosyltransferase [Mycobacterium sp. PS03-16]TFV59923.1 glycosyltransferase [Mycobacterium sp. PS03-16]
MANSARTESNRRTKVSICIPAFQAERHLQTTIDSVLAQDDAGLDLEIVIVDNNSSDGTRRILEKLDDDRVRVIRNETTLPMVDNFNHAIRQSRGEFVKLVCADDTLEPDCIAAQCAVLADNPDVALVAVRTDFIDDAGKLLRRARGVARIAGRHSAQRVVKEIVRSGSNPIGAPVVAMFRRTDFDRCGGFFGDLPFVMEMDLWTRLLRGGDFVGIPRVLAAFRITSGTTTALMPTRSQLFQQIEIARRLSDDTRWQITLTDRIVGRVRCYDMALRRNLLYLISAMRASWRGRRAADGCAATIEVVPR